MNTNESVGFTEVNEIPPENAQEKKAKKYYYGFGGWLILVGIGVIYTFGNALLYSWDTLIPLFQDGQIQALTKIYPNYDTLVYLESLMNLTYIVLPVYIGYLCLKQKKLFKTMMIVYLIINPVFSIAHYYVMNMIQAISTDELMEQESLSVVRTIITGGVWIAYFLRSRRVRNTYFKL